MGQVGIYRIETIAEAEHTRVAQLVDHLEGDDAAFLGDCLERNLGPTLLRVVLNLVDNELKAEVIGKTVGVDLDRKSVV